MIKGMNEKTLSWKDLIENGSVEAAVRRNSRLADAALEFGSTASALRAAWRRHSGSTQTLGDLLGTDIDHSYDDPDLDARYDEKLDGLRLKFGGQKVVVPQRTVNIRPEFGEILLTPGDTHLGIHDAVSMSLMVECAEQNGIDRVILQGDTYDCYGISRHGKSADRIRGGNWTLDDERRCGTDFMNWVASTPKESIFMPGNHEDRLWRMMDENPALEDTLLPRNVFDIPEAIRCTDRRTRIRAGSLVIEHGHHLRGSTREYGVKGVLSRHPDQTTIYGHSHKVAAYGMTTYDQLDRPRRREAITIGHLSVPEQHIDYAGSDMNWQQAFAMVEFWEGRGGKLRYDINVIEIHDHEFSYRGKVYR
jgi:hypothetical protein